MTVWDGAAFHLGRFLVWFGLFVVLCAVVLVLHAMQRRRERREEEAVCVAPALSRGRAVTAGTLADALARYAGRMEEMLARHAGWPVEDLAPQRDGLLSCLTEFAGIMGLPDPFTGGEPMRFAFQRIPSGNGMEWFMVTVLEGPLRVSIPMGRAAPLHAGESTPPDR